MGDVAPFINAFGADNCLLVHIERAAAGYRPTEIHDDLESLPEIRHLKLINNSDPEAMLRQLALLLD